MEGRPPSSVLFETPTSSSDSNTGRSLLLTAETGASFDEQCEKSKPKKGEKVVEIVLPNAVSRQVRKKMQTKTHAFTRQTSADSFAPTG